MTINHQWETQCGRATGYTTAKTMLPVFFRTTAAERMLIFTTVVLLPLENHLPAVGGLSALFLMFVVLAVYIGLNRVASLDRMWLHPVFIAAFLFILVAGALEFTSPLSMYGDLARFGLAMCGALMISCLCRDRSALRAGLYGYMCASLWLSSILFLTSYDVLSGAVVQDFQDASYLRANAFRENPLQGNLNGMALMCAQGGVVALAFALASSARPRFMYMGIAGFCFLSTLLTMSRGGAAISILACTAVLFANGLKHARKLLIVGLLIGGLLVVIPSVIWSRMSFSTEKHHGKMESRAWVYTTALERFPEYAITGIGAGNFWKKWGFEKGFATGTRGSVDVTGAHNTILQIMIYWGALGLVAFLRIVLRVYRCIPSQSGQDELSLGLLGIIVTLGAWLLQSHNFYDKSFALGLGMLIGSRQWIWPSGKGIEPR